ncbi:MAG: DUF4037 domain-containing protein [Chloroflexota bacterium]|jgi:hypothetical protein
MSTIEPPVKFIPGLELARLLYRQAVAPILAEAYPDLPYSAGLLGTGSEVLGFDDVMSTDHHWGPRLLLFLRSEDEARLATEISQNLARQLPPNIAGYSTHWSEPDPDDGGNQFMRPAGEGPINHRITITTPADFFCQQLVFDIANEIEPADWLSFPEQRLRTLSAGAIFHDGLGLKTNRSRFDYYPTDVWLYLLAAGWARIGQEEHLMGRAGLAGDELGSAIIGARLVRDIMRLCFLMERVYAPYPKWFGKAFALLDSGSQIGRDLEEALAARRWQARQRHLVAGYRHLARLHNRLQLTEPMPEEATSFYGRPFQVMAFHGFADALLAQISDPQVRRIARRRPIGSVDQFSDSTDLLSYPAWRPWLRAFYEPEQKTL